MGNRERSREGTFLIQHPVFAIILFIEQIQGCSAHLTFNEFQVSFHFASQTGAAFVFTILLDLFYLFNAAARFVWFL